MAQTAQGRQKIAKLLANDDSFATSMLAVCLNEYGTEFFDWDPESLWMTLSEEFNVSIPRVNKDKIQALLLTYTTNLFVVSVETFNHVCNVLSGSEANFRYWDMLSPEEALWGMYEVALNTTLDRDPGEKSPEFSHEVRQYLGVVLRADGITDPPDLLRVAEGFEPDGNIDDWADDPEMFNAAYDLQKTNKARLLEFLGTRILGLTDELADLPLEFGEEWAEFRKRIEASAQRLVKEHQSASLART